MKLPSLNYPAIGTGYEGNPMLFIRILSASVGAALLLSATQSLGATETPLETAVATGSAARHWANLETANCPACSMPPPYIPVSALVLVK